MRTIDELISRAGAPLWSLRCTRAEYETVRDTVRRMRANDQHYPRLWVLAAAEAIRREYRGGSWSWDVVRGALGEVAEDRQIEVGLRAWDRPIRQGRDGSHLRLSSLICEGGLANHLLAAEGNALRAWSHGVLRDFREIGLQGDEPPADLAELAARRTRAFTQSYLRDPGVHELVGRLLGALWHLRVRHGAFPSSDVVGWLDTRDRDWRSRLPLDIEDAVAQKLLVDLLGEVENVARPPARPCVRTWIQNGRIEREIVLPGTFAPSVLAEIFGAPDALPRRVDLTLVHEGRRERLAQLERGGDGWRCVAKPRSVVGTGEVRVELEGGLGRGLAATGLAGAAPLPDLPWVFAPERERWRLVGFGSVRHPAACLRVALPPGCAGDATEVGTIEGRSLVEVRGEHTFTRDGDVFRVGTGASQDEDAGEMVLEGRRYRWARDEDEIFVGPPQPWCVTEEGSRRRVPSEQLRVSEGAGWRPWPPAGGGRARIRWVLNGEVRAERTFAYLPVGLTIETRDVTSDGGLIEVRDRLARLGVPRPLGFDARPERDALRLRARPGGHPPARVGLRLLFQNNREVEVFYPYPCERDAFYDRDGQPVTRAIGLHELAGLRAEARGATGRPALRLRLKSGVEQEERIRSFPESEDGLHALELRDLRADVSELFSATDNQDAEVAVEIIWLGGPTRAPKRLEVRRYDRLLVPDKAAGTVTIDPALKTEERVDVFACRFVAPAEVIRLKRLSPGFRWIFDRKEAGSWLIAARDAFAPVARPVAWFVAGDDGAEGALAASMRIFDEAERRAAMRAALVEIAEGRGTEADNILLEQSVALLDQAEASALDVVRVLATVPALAARLAVFAVDDEHLARLWDGLDSLPFLWETVPVSAWQAALNTLHAELTGAFPNRPDRVWTSIGRAADAVHARFPAFDTTYQPWRLSMGLDNCRSDFVAMARLIPSTVQEPLKGAARDLQTRHADDQWPTLPQTNPTRLGHYFPGVALPEPDRHTGSHCWPVQLAPAAAAACAMDGRQPTPDQVGYLRQLRAFDRDWFDAAYALTLTLLTARQPVVFR